MKILKPLFSSKYRIKLIFLFLFFLTACDTTSFVEERRKVIKKFSIRVVHVPFGSAYGPKYAENIMAGSLKKAPEKSFYKEDNLPEPSSFGCVGSWANTEDNDPKYYYYTKFLYFPESFIKRSKYRYKYVTTKALSPKGPDGKIMGMTHCIVPLVDGIANMLEDILKIYGNKNSPGTKLTMKTTSWELTPDHY